MTRFGFGGSMSLCMGPAGKREARRTQCQQRAGGQNCCDPSHGISPRGFHLVRPVTEKKLQQLKPRALIKINLPWSATGVDAARNRRHARE
jgi:hypothetical protein